MISGGFELLHEAVQTAYQNTYGYTNDEPLELVNLRLAARGVRTDRLTFEDVERHVCALDIPDCHRDAWFPSADGYISTDTFARTVISERTVSGPAILQAYDTTIVLPPDAEARSDGCGSILIDVPDSVLEQ